MGGGGGMHGKVKSRRGKRFARPKRKILWYNINKKQLAPPGRFGMRARWEMCFKIFYSFFFNAPFTKGHQKRFKGIKKKKKNKELLYKRKIPVVVIIYPFKQNAEEEMWDDERKEKVVITFIIIGVLAERVNVKSRRDRKCRRRRILYIRTLHIIHYEMLPVNISQFSKHIKCELNKYLNWMQQLYILLLKQIDLCWGSKIRRIRL